MYASYLDSLAYASDAHLEIPSHPERLTWAALCSMAPRLVELERRIIATPGRGRNWREWSAIKREFSVIVGWDAACGSALATHEAYDLVYSRLLRAWEGNS